MSRRGDIKSLHFPRVLPWEEGMQVLATCASYPGAQRGPRGEGRELTCWAGGTSRRHGPPCP